MGDRTGDESMADIAREYLRRRYDKPGNVFLGVVHRLDRPVSGVLLFARTSKAAARLADQFRRGTVRKIYDAVLSGTVVDREASLTDWIVKDSRTNISRVVPEGTKGARSCLLSYRVLRAKGGKTRVEVEPKTGRSHQIRIQFASRGTPIVGDVKYGSHTRLGERILLHARCLEFDHPTKKTRITLTKEPDSSFD